MRGYDLILIARRKDRLEVLSQELQHKYGIQAEILVAELGNEADLKRAGDAIEANERITLVVNNAGTHTLVRNVA
jgi:short-subunit dehydrogenase